MNRGEKAVGEAINAKILTNASNRGIDVLSNLPEYIQAEGIWPSFSH
jgi:hypothetical protein